MSNFDRFHPALQHHIVNSLGWRELRPFQDTVIPQLLDGQHLIILAPTAGGKTEAAFFPVLSRMLTEGWSGLSVLYICPIKALLNNLDIRLQRYCSLLGRRSAVWHGDVKQSVRKHTLREPPDCLLTTPESLEVMLVSPQIDAQPFFSQLRVVIVDEIHAFAGDDRGWHLLSVLSRISRLAGREIQRIGLSATVGNPETLVDWLAGSCQGKRSVCLPPETQPSTEAEITLDYVGSLRNAAIVISRLHRGEKRLVFVDSRSRAEQLASELRQLETTTFITHSSLSQEQRHQAEEAFAARHNCVIVATSVLELGIDVGDLDRVIQIDSPPSVSSFLQRMGRTGRRSGSQRNCLFLATRDETLVQTAGVIDLWLDGYIEPIIPPPAPYHILAQQLMALALQEKGIGKRAWLEWISHVSAFVEMPAEHVAQLVSWMLQHDILWDDQGILWFGREGEEMYGRRHFLDLISVFTSPPLFSVRHGRQDIGFVDELTFFGKQDGPHILSLGGRAWQVKYIDWPRRVAYVEVSEAKGRSRWRSASWGLSFRLCQAIKHIVTTTEDSVCWSQRTQQRMEEIREEFGWLSPDGAVVLKTENRPVEWWTFAGAKANMTLAHELSQLLERQTSADSLHISFISPGSNKILQQALDTLRLRNVQDMRPAVEEKALSGLKFSECLPLELARHVLETRLCDPLAMRDALCRPVQFVQLSSRIPT